MGNSWFFLAEATPLKLQGHKICHLVQIWNYSHSKFHETTLKCVDMLISKWNNITLYNTNLMNSRSFVCFPGSKTHRWSIVITFHHLDINISTHFNVISWNLEWEQFQICTKWQILWPCSFRGVALAKKNQELPIVAMFFTRARQNEEVL
jgi:hypothetical protein